MRLTNLEHARAVAAMLNETNKATYSLCPTLDEIVAANAEKHQAHLAERKVYDEYRREKVTVIEVIFGGEFEVERTREELDDETAYADAMGDHVEEAEHIVATTGMDLVTGLQQMVDARCR